MKRSAVNAALRQAEDTLTEFRWALPAWARWQPSDFAANPETAAFLCDHQMGWDVTDFGLGDFGRRGLTLFCVRNGMQSDPNSVPYAEKLLFVAEDQETPFHCHHVKMEDIINRGGGNLIIEFRHEDERDAPISIMVDGRKVTLAPDEPLRLTPGESVTIPRRLYHRFYGEPGHGLVFCGEVSQVNDDNVDNYFLEPVGRFSSIEANEPPLYPLWNETGGTA
ncbi:MAG: D-lyxose/D-mannose family sugar isomerase [Pseudomonadota bacterium]